MLEDGSIMKAIEIKSGETINQDFFKGLEFFGKISNIPDEHRFLVYGGEKEYKRSAGKVLGWDNFVTRL